MSHGEPLQLKRSQWHGIGNCARIANEQSQCLRAVRNETYGSIVEPADQRRDGLARHPAANEAHRRRTCDRESPHVARCEEGIAVAEGQFAVALKCRAASADVDADEEIVRAVGGGSAGAYGLTQSAQCSRHDSKAGKSPFGEIDMKRAVRQGLERLDRFELAG